MVQDYQIRWLAYFDLLGFKKFIEEKNFAEARFLYKKLLRRLRDKEVNFEKITIKWFSDTFLIYTKNDSIESFRNIEAAARLFYSGLVVNEKIPVRGALTIGELYADNEDNMIFGKALIDAYIYGENQNWIGFSITPKAYETLKDTEADISKLYNYRRIDFGDIKKFSAEDIFAYTMNDGRVIGKNPFIKSLAAMKEIAPEKDKIKYQNSLDFIKKHSYSQ